MFHICSSMKLDRRVCYFAGSAKMHTAVIRLKVLKPDFCSGRVRCASYNINIIQLCLMKIPFPTCVRIDHSLNPLGNNKFVRFS